MGMAPLCCEWLDNIRENPVLLWIKLCYCVAQGHTEAQHPLHSPHNIYRLLYLPWWDVNFAS